MAAGIGNANTNFRIRSGGVLEYGEHGGCGGVPAHPSSTRLVPERGYHAAATRSGTNVSLFVDGVRITGMTSIDDPGSDATACPTCTSGMVVSQYAATGSGRIRAARKH